MDNLDQVSVAIATKKLNFIERKINEYLREISQDELDELATDVCIEYGTQNFDADLQDLEQNCQCLDDFVCDLIGHHDYQNPHHCDEDWWALRTGLTRRLAKKVLRILGPKKGIKMKENTLKTFEEILRESSGGYYGKNYYSSMRDIVDDYAKGWFGKTQAYAIAEEFDWDLDEYRPWQLLQAEELDDEDDDYDYCPDCGEDVRYCICGEED